jgi:hypothetical protein
MVVAVQLLNRSVRGGEYQEIRQSDVSAVWESVKFKRTKSNRMLNFVIFSHH